jgi:hypothetical protein
VPGKDAVDTAVRSATEVAVIFMQVLVGNRYRWLDHEMEVIDGAVLRLKAHEKLMREVLPGLHNRLIAVEAGKRSEPR